MKLSASLALWNEVLASETASGWSSWCWAMSRAHRGKAEFAAEKQEQCFRAGWAGSGVREEA